jgi:hypothetical protein
MNTKHQEHASPRPDQTDRSANRIMVMLWGLVVFCFAAWAYVLCTLPSKCLGD